MAQGGGSQAATVAAEQASQQPGNSLFFRGHEAEAVNQEQPEHILGKGLSIKDVRRRGEASAGFTATWKFTFLPGS